MKLLKLLKVMAAIYGLLQLAVWASFARLKAIEEADPDTERWWTTRDFGWAATQARYEELQKHLPLSYWWAPRSGPESGQA